MLKNSIWMVLELLTDHSKHLKTLTCALLKGLGSRCHPHYLLMYSPYFKEAQIYGGELGSYRFFNIID